VPDPWMLLFLALVTVLLGALAGASAARGLITSLIHRIVSAESFLRGRAAADARAAYRSREEERIRSWRAARGDSDIESQVYRIPERDDGVPR